MGDAGDRFALLARGGRHKRARCAEEDVVKLTLVHSVKQVRAKHAARAAASRAARMDVLRVDVKYHHAAVAVHL